MTYLTCDRLGSEPDVDGRLLAPRLNELGVTVRFHPWGGPFADPAPAAYVVKATWDYIDRPDQFAAWVSAATTRSPVWNRPDLLRWNMHKSYLCDLRRAGLATVPTRLVRRGEPAEAAWQAQRWTDVVIKPAISVGALNTRRFAAADPAGLGFLTELSARGDVLIQPFVGSILTDGETSLVYLGGTFSHAVHKGVPPDGFAAQPRLGVTVTPVVPTSDQLRLADAVMARLDAPLLARVDLVRHEGAPAVMELELIEPHLFFDVTEAAADRFAHAIATRLCRAHA